MIPLKDDHQKSPPREIFVHGNFASATVSSTVKSTHTKNNPKRFTFDQFSESHATNTTMSENESAEFRDAITESRRGDPCRLPPSPEMQRKTTKRMMPAAPTVASTIFDSQRKHRGEGLRRQPDSLPTPEIFVPRDTPRGRNILVETVPVISTERRSTTKCSSLAASSKKSAGKIPRSPENPMWRQPTQLASTVIGVVSDTKKFTSAIKGSEELRPKEDEAQSQPGRIVPTVEIETKQHCAKSDHNSYESNLRKTEDLLEGAIDVAKEEKRSVGSKRQSPPGRKFDTNHQCTTITKDTESSAVLDDPQNGKDQKAEQEAITEEKPSDPKKTQRLVFDGIPLIISPGNTEASLANAKYSNEPVQSNISALTETVSDKEDSQKATTNDRVVANLLDEELVTQAPSDENNVQAHSISATAQMISDHIPCADLDFFPCCLRQGGVCYY